MHVYIEKLLLINTECFSVGFMTRDERKKFESLRSPYNKYWIPCVWFANLAAVARCEGRIKDNNTYKLLMEVMISLLCNYCLCSQR